MSELEVQEQSYFRNYFQKGNDVIHCEISVASPVSSGCLWHRMHEKSELLGFNPALQLSGHTQGEESLWFSPHKM